MLNEWSKVDLAKGGVMLNTASRLDIKLISLRHDKETTAKSTQSVAELECNGKKVKLHLYHTNQSALIQGSNHDIFYRQFILKMLDELCQLLQNKIKRFNQLIISTMMPQATSLWAHKMGRAGVRRNPYNTSQTISQDSLGLPSLGKEPDVEPTLDETASLRMEDQVTSTPNPSPVSSPTNSQSVILLTPPAPVPLCSQAAEYLQKHQQNPKTPPDMTSSQRIILPEIDLLGSPLPSSGSSMDEPDDLWTSLGITDSLRTEAGQLPASRAALAVTAAPGTTSTGPTDAALAVTTAPGTTSTGPTGAALAVTAAPGTTSTGPTGAALAVTAAPGTTSTGPSGLLPSQELHAPRPPTSEELASPEVEASYHIPGHRQCMTI